jgi:hypothetical protein
MLIDPKTRWRNGQNLPYYLSDKLLPHKFNTGGGAVVDNVYQFTATDNVENYQKNLRDMPVDWWYRTKPVFYKINSKGYRAPEWENIKWEKTIVLFGCSMTLGTGLAEDETIAWYLNQILNKQVINLGVGGSSIQYTAYNNMLLHKNFPKPWAVVNLWTDINRVVQFTENTISHEGVWSMTKDSMMDRWTENPINPIIHARMLTDTTKELWKDKVKYWEGSFFKHTSRCLNITEIEHTNTARDNLHLGWNDALNTAKIIANNLG